MGTIGLSLFSAVSFMCQSVALSRGGGNWYLSSLVLALSQYPNTYPLYQLPIFHLSVFLFLPLSPLNSPNKKLSPNNRNKLPESRTVFRFTHSAHLQVNCLMSTTWRTYNKQNHEISYRDIPLRATTQHLPFSTLLFSDISLLSWNKSIKSSDVLQRNTSLAICAQQHYFERKM